MIWGKTHYFRKHPHWFSGFQHVTSCLSVKNASGLPHFGPSFAHGVHHRRDEFWATKKGTNGCLRYIGDEISYPVIIRDYKPLQGSLFYGCS